MKARRLFLALWPNTEVRQALQRIQAAREFGGKPTHAQDLHLTLVFLGHSTEQQRHCVERVCAHIRAPGFDLILRRTGCFRRSGIYWCGPEDTPEPLARLTAGLREGLRGCGYEPEHRAYRPHVTLIRKGRCLVGAELPRIVHWPVDEFVLVESETGREGARYRLLKRWRLGLRPPPDLLVADS